MQFFHGSINPIPNNTILKPNPEGYVKDCLLEELFESVRPKHCLSRFKSVYVCESAEDIDYCGGFNDYIYIVKPSDTLQKSDLAWYSHAQTLLEDNNINEAKQAALNYWNGIQFYKKEYSVFEYRTAFAIVLDEFFD